jgi:Mrp family chromosome partitioning ATPase
LGTLTFDKELTNFEQYANLAANIISKTTEGKRSIMVTSSIRREGKTFLTNKLSNIFIQMGYSVAVLHLNPFEKCEVNFFFDQLLKNSTYKSEKEEITHFGYAPDCKSSSLTLAHKNFTNLINDIRSNFDIILMDSPASVISPDTANLIKFCDFGIYLVRSKFSKAQFISNVDLLQEETNFDQMNIVLNGVHPTTNHSGNFNGSRLNYQPSPKGFLNTVKHYFKVYVQ